jgi:PTS system N-acetylglucosamine-specific IIC component
MLPIAVLPVAGLLLRLGQPDMLNLQFVAAAGDSVFHNLGLLFAIGVAVGFAQDGHGAAGLAGVVCFLVATNGAEVLIPVPAGSSTLLAAAFRDSAINRLGVPLGILSGVIAGAAYNRFSAIKVPEYLAFFGGRRFVPIVSGFAGIFLALIFGFGWTWLDAGVQGASRAMVAAGPFGLFAYGALNRLLIVTGLHHILNNIVWFILGDYHGSTGDLHRFFAGDPTAGAFMSGFFPVMMFGLPAACLAMYHTARPDRRAAVGGMLASLALTALLTGVTEPIEFTFMFLAPGLYLLHALLTGGAMVVMDALHVRLGFSFSAGLFDYLINFGKATRPLMLLPVGAVYFAIYYGAFRFTIQYFDLKTPGREPEADLAPAPSGGANGAQELSRGRAFVDALGGERNLTRIDACTTRLRLVVASQDAVDEGALKALGARGLLRPSKRDLQVVLGPIADQVAREMRVEVGGVGSALVAAAPTALQAEATSDVTQEDRRLAECLTPALGGRANLLSIDAFANRLLVTFADCGLVDEVALGRVSPRGFARPRPASAQVVLDRSAMGVAAAITALS